MDKIGPLKIARLLETLGDPGFLQCLRVVSSDYGKPRLRVFQLKRMEFVIGSVLVCLMKLDLVISGKSSFGGGN